jgi:SAM-dependent methyltransferase
MYPETTTSITIIREIRNQAFKEQATNIDYTRGRDLWGYIQELPKFQKKDITELIRERTRKDDSLISILDVGCGRAIALRDLKKLYGDRIEVHGISAYDYRNLNNDSSNKHKNKYQDLVDYRVGDAQNLFRIFQGLSFDFIVSVFGDSYCADRLSVLRQEYMLLNKGGIILKSPSEIGLDRQTANNLKGIWAKEGIESEIEVGDIDDKLALKKTSDVKLPLPFRYQVESNYYLKPKNRISYIFDQNK